MKHLESNEMKLLNSKSYISNNNFYQMELIEEFLNIPRVMFITLNQEGRIIAINDEGAKMLGYSKSEVINKNWIDDFIPQKNKEEKKAIFTSMINGKYNSTGYHENHILTKNGEEKIFLWHSRSIKDSGGQFMGIYGSGVDISKRKQIESKLKESEEKFKIIAEKSIVGIAIILDSSFEYINPKLARTFGYKKSELLGRNFTDIVPEEEKANIEKKIVKKLLADHPMIFFEFTGIKKNGEKIYLQAHGAKIKYLGQHGIIATILDITRRKKMEEEIAKMQKLEALGVLAGGIFHDFYNLLTIIIGNLNILKKNVNSKDQLLKPLSRIEKASLSIADLLDQYYSISEKMTIDINEVILDKFIEKTVKQTLSNPKIKYEIHVLDEIPSIPCDKQQISLLLKNIIQNAEEAMPKGGLLQIFLKKIELKRGQFIGLKKGCYAMIDISDNGRGIPKKHLSKIFDPYFSTKQDVAQKGLGLGLTIANSIVRRHSGFIEVESETGRGTRVNIYIPLKQREISDLMSGEEINFGRTKTHNSSFKFSHI